MKQERLSGLADGIFAIVMTLLALDIKVPHLPEPVTNYSLWLPIVKMSPLFVGYVLSFVLLFIYWRAHHLVVSIYAKNVDYNLTGINALFFLFIALVPFTSSMIGQYSYNQLAIIIYGLNIITIGVTLYWMKYYVIYSNTIENNLLTERDIRNGNIRILFPVYCAFAAMVISFFSTDIALLFFPAAIIFNLIPHSTNLIIKIQDYFKKQAGI
jgi:uncharacterized membrane protein